MRRFRNPPKIQTPFSYQDHGLNPIDVPLFMKLVLDDPFTTLDEKDEFLEKFGYRYLSDPDFRKNVDGDVLVFEKHKYIDYTKYSYINDIGNPNIKKGYIKIGEVEMLGAYYSSVKLTYTDHFYEMKNNNIINYPHPNHYYVDVKVTHLPELLETKFTHDELIFDTGNQITTFPCPRYWNYDNNEFDHPTFEDSSSNSSNMDVYLEEQILNNTLFEGSDSIEFWKDAYENYERTYLGTVGSPTPVFMIYLKNPLYISVNNLRPKPIYKFVISANYYEPLMQLLGLDITEQYDYHSIRIKVIKTMIIEEPKDYDDW